MTATLTLPNSAKVVKKTFTPNLMRAFEILENKENKVEFYPCNLWVSENNLKYNEGIYIELGDSDLCLLVNPETGECSIYHASNGERVPIKVNEQVRAKFLAYAEEIHAEIMREECDDEDRQADLEDLRYMCYKESKHLV